MAVDTSFTPGKYDYGSEGFLGAKLGTGDSLLSFGGEKDFLEKHGANLAIGAIALQGFASAMGGKAQIENIFENVNRTEANIEQMESQLMDALGIQARKVSKRHGSQMARVGKSGVAFSGSPLMVMAETHRRGMEDFEAIEQKGRFAIESAYQSIYDQLDQARDIGKGMMIGAVTTLASAGASGYNTGFLKP